MTRCPSSLASAAEPIGISFQLRLFLCLLVAGMDPVCVFGNAPPSAFCRWVLGALLWSSLLLVLRRLTWACLSLRASPSDAGIRIPLCG